MSADLVAFIEARLTEDETVARAAGGDEWTVDHNGRAICGDGMTIYDEGGHDEHQAEHIARHDPARVLREIEAKQRILAEHHVPAPADTFVGQDDRRCVGCGATYEEEPRVEDINDCPVLRALSSVWSDHPDYRAWQGSGG